MMLEDAPKSTRQLCTFRLKISTINKKGGVMDFDHFPIMVLFKAMGILLKSAIMIDDLPLQREVIF